MAADLMDVGAICNLASEASKGYFESGQIILEEAFRLYQEGARLGDARCCACLGGCYLLGEGTEHDSAKAFKWSKKAAEKCNARGMYQCAHCYIAGTGVEQSAEQAIYWFEKYLELEDDESTRNLLSQLRISLLI